MPRDTVVLFSRPDGLKLIQKHCRRASIRIGDLRALVDLEADQVGRDRKAGLWSSFDEILDGIEDEGGADAASTDKPA